MKITLVNNFFGPMGGAERSTYLTYQLLQAKGHDVTFFAMDKKPYFEPDYPWQQYFPPYLDYDDAPPGLVTKLKSIPRVFYNTDAEKRFAAFLDVVQPDIIHCGNLHYHLTPSILAAAKKRRIPVVMTLRDVRLVCPAGTLMRGGTTYCKEELCVTGSALNCITHNCYDQNRLQSTVVTAEFLFRKWHHLYDSVKLFISPSQALSDLAARSGISQDKLMVINNFIEDAVFQHEPHYEAGDYFLFVGRISPEKGVHFALEAMTSLPPEAKLHIVGEGPDEAKLKTQAQRLGLTNVTFLGYLIGEALQREYQYCRASLVPSNWFENFSRTVIESVAYGKPVIGSHVGGISEVVEDGINGYLVPPGELAPLVAAMKTLWENPQQAEVMGRAARQKAERDYNQTIYLNKLIAAYTQLLPVKNAI